MMQYNHETINIKKNHKEINCAVINCEEINHEEYNHKGINCEEINHEN